MTGIGGGTARDLILGVPVFWVEQPLHILICATTAIGVFFTAHLLESRYRLTSLVGCYGAGRLWCFWRL